jgi:glycosyltransferase involved in cell wall biosynthesis
VISVIIPAYNAAPYLDEAMRSVLTQTFVDLELIVVNDGSTDNTGDVVRSFTDPRILAIDRKNGGVSAARNTGIAAARGAYVSFLDADDAMEPSNLSEKLEALARTGKDWVYGDLIICDEHLGNTGRVLRGTDEDVVRTILLCTDTAVPAMCSNAVLKRSCFNAGYRFPLHLSNAADQHFAMSMAQAYSHHHLPRALDRYRVLPQSMSRNVALYEADHMRLFDEAERMELLRDERFARICRSNLHWSIGGSWWINGRSPLRALPHFLQAVFTDPGIISRRLKRSQRRGTAAT